MNHPNIIKLVGIILRPKAMLLMEYAELGSLNTLSPYVCVSNNLKHRIAMQVMCIIIYVMGRCTCKSYTGLCIPLYIPVAKASIFIVVFFLPYPNDYFVILMFFFSQVASGLAFLHKNKVIYRDLKPGNILIFSLSFNAKVSSCSSILVCIYAQVFFCIIMLRFCGSGVDETIFIQLCMFFIISIICNITYQVNAKLSDYGISTYATEGGLREDIGTAGYKAPELLKAKTSKMPYDCKARVNCYPWRVSVLSKLMLMMILFIDYTLILQCDA